MIPVQGRIAQSPGSGDHHIPQYENNRIIDIGILLSIKAWEGTVAHGGGGHDCDKQTVGVV